ncbi:MAG: hypothetical protein RLZZ78_2023 [Armatimonadota bacterium]
MWVIERAHEEDFQVLEGLVESTFIETWTGIVDDTHLQQHLAGGYAVGHVSSDNDEFSLHNYYKLEKLYLRASAQGHGLGRRLWNIMVDVASGYGAPGIYLTHYPLNLRASNFYSRIGLRKVAETIYECGDGEYRDWVLAAKWDELDLTSDEKGVTA